MTVARADEPRPRSTIADARAPMPPAARHRLDGGDPVDLGSIARPRRASFVHRDDDEGRTRSGGLASTGRTPRT